MDGPFVAAIGDGASIEAMDGGDRGEGLDLIDHIDGLVAEFVGDFDLVIAELLAQ